MLTHACCAAMLDITVGPDVGTAAKGHAALVCDLESGHDGLHHDDQDRVWWRPDESFLPG